MLDPIYQNLDRAFRCLIQKLLLRHGYSCLWVLRRCFARTRLYRLVPFAYALSGVVQLTYITITFGTLWLIATNAAHWLVILAMLAGLLLLGRLQQAHRLPIFIGLVLLLPICDLAFSSRLMLCLMNWTVAFINLRGHRIAWNQFQFKPFYMQNINEGSATVLQGRIEVVEVFVHTEQAWEDAEIELAHDSVSRALDWLVAQAARYKVRVSFQQHLLWTSVQKAAPNRRADKQEHIRFADWLESHLKSHLEDFQTIAHSNWFVIVHTHCELEDASAYAVPRYILQEAMTWPEYTVVGPPHAAQVYAHEILHLFGADDFYMRAYDRAEEPMRQQLLKNCIMFDAGGPDFSSALVDDLTAENVGWA